MSDINATEAAVKLAAENDIDLSALVGTGAEGRITKADVEARIAALVSNDPPPLTNAERDAQLGYGPVGLPAGAVVVPEADPVAAEIMALPNLGAIINWPGDRTAYAAVLQARALELLGKA